MEGSGHIGDRWSQTGDGAFRRQQRGSENSRRVPPDNAEFEPSPTYKELMDLQQAFLTASMTIHEIVRQMTGNVRLISYAGTAGLITEEFRKALEEQGIIETTEPE